MLDLLDRPLDKAGFGETEALTTAPIHKQYSTGQQFLSFGMLSVFTVFGVQICQFFGG